MKITWTILEKNTKNDQSLSPKKIKPKDVKENYMTVEYMEYHDKINSR